MNCIAPAVCSLLFVTSMAWSAPAPGFTSSFEPTDPPTAWNVADNGVSTPSAGQAHTGKRSLKIADPDDQTGSNARSARIAVEPGKECLVSVWTFLESGDPQGLGVYLDLLGADGKRLDEASERSSQRPTMQQGKWTRLLFTVAPPAEAEQAGLWLHTFSLYGNGDVLRGRCRAQAGRAGRAGPCGRLAGRHARGPRPEGLAVCPAMGAWAVCLAEPPIR